MVQAYLMSTDTDAEQLVPRKLVSANGTLLMLADTSDHARPLAAIADVATCAAELSAAVFAQERMATRHIHFSSSPLAA